MPIHILFNNKMEQLENNLYKTEQSTLHVYMQFILITKHKDMYINSRIIPQKNPFLSLILPFLFFFFWLIKDEVLLTVSSPIFPSNIEGKIGELTVRQKSAHRKFKK
jgi:hypothetical protein